MRIEITDECGEIKLGDTLLPGIMQKISVDGSVKFDEKSVSGSSGAKKQVIGYEDARISVVLILPNDDQSTPFVKLQSIVNLFHSLDEAAKPQIYQLTNEHTAAWGISEVLFQSCRTEDDNRRDYIKATLDFVEWEPVLVQVEERAVRGKIKDRKTPVTNIEGMGDFKLAERQLEKMNIPSIESVKDSVEMPESPAVDDDDGI